MSDGKTSLNLELLIKLLKLTTSSNDSEALLSCRKANEQLAKFGGDWEALLRGKVTVIADPFTAAPPNSDQIHRRTSTAPSAPPPPAPPRPAPTAPPRTPSAPPPQPSYYQQARQKQRAYAASATVTAQSSPGFTAGQTRNTLRKQRVQLDDIA